MHYSDPHRISAAPPRCSPNTRLGNKPRECAFGEQWEDAAEILYRIGVEHKNEASLHILGLSVENAGQFERVTIINIQRLHIYK